MPFVPQPIPNVPGAIIEQDKRRKQQDYQIPMMEIPGPPPEELPETGTRWRDVNQKPPAKDRGVVHIQM